MSCKGFCPSGAVQLVHAGVSSAVQTASCSQLELLISYSSTWHSPAARVMQAPLQHVTVLHPFAWAQRGAATWPNVKSQCCSLLV